MDTLASPDWTTVHYPIPSLNSKRSCSQGGDRTGHLQGVRQVPNIQSLFLPQPEYVGPGRYHWLTLVCPVTPRHRCSIFRTAPQVGSLGLWSNYFNFITLIYLFIVRRMCVLQYEKSIARISFLLPPCGLQRFVIRLGVSAFPSEPPHSLALIKLLKG